MVLSLEERGIKIIKILDLRPRILRENKNGSFYYEKTYGDPLGYVEIDLGEESLLNILDQIPGTHSGQRRKVR
jgi:hypothetical protein